MTEVPAAKHSPWAAFAIVALGTFMATLDSSIVNIALPTLSRTFTVAMTTVEWVSLAYLLTITGLLLPLGGLGDRMGRRRLYTAGIALFTIGSALCATASSFPFLVSARVAQGVGAALVSANSAALVTAVFPPESRGRALGLIGAVVGLGLTVGPPLGGWLLDLGGWRWIFLVNLPVGIVVAFLGLAWLPADKPRAAGSSGATGFDWAGSTLATVALVLTAFWLSRGAGLGWWSAASLILFAMSALAAVSFVVVERRARVPLVEGAIVREPVVANSLAALFLAFVALFFAVFLVPFYLEHIAGFTPGGVGRVLVVIPLLLLVLSPLAGGLSDRFGSRVLAALGLAVSATGYALLAWLVAGATERPLGAGPLVLGLMVVGLGQALFMAPNSSSVMGAVPASRLSTAGSLLATMRNLGILFGIALAAAVYEGRDAIYHAGHSPVAAAAFAMRDAFLVAGIVAALGAVLVLSPRARHRSG